MIMKVKGTTLRTYSKVSKSRGMWNSRGGWKKHRKGIAEGVAIVREPGKTESFNNQRVGEVAFKLLFLSFSK